MSKYSKFSALYASFYSTGLYQDVYARWKGVGAIYLLLLVFIVSSLSAYTGTKYFEKYIFSDEGVELRNEISAEIISQMPTLIWDKSGVLSVEDEKPEGHVISITVEGEKTPIALIDTDKSVDDWYGGDTRLLLNAKGVHVRESKGSKSRYWVDFFDIPFVLDKERATEMYEGVSEWVKGNKLLIYLGYSAFGIFMLFLAFIYRMVQSVILGGLGVLLQKIYKSNHDIQDLIRLSVVAITPALIIDTVLIHTGIGGMPWALSAIISIGYLVFALRAVSKHQTAES